MSSIEAEKQKELQLENAPYDGDSGEYVHFDEKEDARILRKIDWQLLPFVSLLYLLSFMDRSNIGNAKIAGLVPDLKLKGLEYNICAAIFFITYSLAEVPSNVALKLVKPSIWIPSIMVAWGIVMTLMGLVKDFKGLLIARLFLGLTEAGLFPGVNFIISLWYRRKEQAFRTAIFFSAATLAGCFGGLLAAAIAKMDGIAGLNGWAWIFILEGILTVIVAIIAYFTMHDYPQTARFLTEAERRHVVERLRVDHGDLATHVDKRFFWQAILDYKSYLYVIMYMGILIPLYAFSLFLPTIVNGLGYAGTHAQLMSVPPYVGGCIATVLIGWYSDKIHVRGPFILGSSVTAIVGYVLLLSSPKPGVGYTGAMIVALGIFPSIPVSISWVGNNVGGDLKKGVVMAMVIGIGNLGGICSSFVYLPKDSPRYFTGHGVMIGSLAVTFVTASIMIINFKRLNKQKEAICMRDNIGEERRAEFRDMGDASPLYRYTF
ncbi:hypothetical protein FRC02_001978 [Tulasnella sp. 418]|nr:hypothetical protein FRC02_001978 [Tulasnella sp. 418]